MNGRKEDTSARGMGGMDGYQHGLHSENSPKKHHIPFRDDQLDLGETQIKTPDELVLGLKFRQAEMRGVQIEIMPKIYEVVSVIPNEKEPDKPLVGVRCFNEGEGIIRYPLSLKDNSIVPYDDGKWNASWGLVRVEKQNQE